MRKDFLLDDDRDLSFEEGDFVVGESDAQHIEHLIVSFPLDWKEFPLTGVGIEKYLNSNDQERLKRDILETLKGDKCRVKRLGLSDDFEINLEV